MQYTVVPVTFNVNFPGSCWTRYGFLFSVVQSLNIFPPGWLAVTWLWPGWTTSKSGRFCLSQIEESSLLSGRGKATRTTIIWTLRVSVRAREEPVLIGEQYWHHHHQIMIDCFQPDQAGDEQREASELGRHQQVHHADLQTAAERERQVATFYYLFVWRWVDNETDNYPRYDQTIFTNGSQPVIWAVGPVNSKVDLPGQRRAEQ